MPENASLSNEFAQDLSMSEAGYEQFVHNQVERKKDLERYEAFVKARLMKYPETSTAPGRATSGRSFLEAMKKLRRAVKKMSQDHKTVEPD